MFIFTDNGTDVLQDRTNKRTFSESTIQAELYRRLKNHAISIDLEYSNNHSRFDLIVFMKNKPVIIVEVKKGKVRARNSKQIQKYRKYNYPLIVVEGWKDVQPCVNWILDFINIKKRTKNKA